METKPSENTNVRWVSTGWLVENLIRRDLRIIDTQPHINDYLKEHIPGAVYFNEQLLRISLNGIPAKYITEEVAGVFFSRIGLDMEKPVVVYTGIGTYSGTGDCLAQAEVAYGFLRFGHRNVYILDGGIDKWEDEGRPLGKGFPKVHSSIFIPRLRSDFITTMEDLKQFLNRDNVVLIDARTRDIYDGHGFWIKPGHIPGAINIPSADFLCPENQAKLRPEEEIKEIFESKGVTPDKTVICSCGYGRVSTVQFLLLKFLFKYPRVKMYERSFVEWSAHPENETITGLEP